MSLYTSPLNNRGLWSNWDADFFSKYTGNPPYPWVLHLQIQPTADQKQYSQFVIRNLRMWRASCMLSVFYRGLEYPWMLVSEAYPGIDPPQTLSDDCRLSFWGLRRYSGFLTVWGGHSVPLTPTLFRGQLYIYSTNKIVHCEVALENSSGWGCLAAWRLQASVFISKCIRHLEEVLQTVWLRTREIIVLQFWRPEVLIQGIGRVCLFGRC